MEEALSLLTSFAASPVGLTILKSCAAGIIMVVCAILAIYLSTRLPVVLCRQVLWAGFVMPLWFLSSMAAPFFGGWWSAGPRRSGEMLGTGDGGSVFG